MNQVTKWYEHPLFYWMDSNEFISKKAALDSHCNTSVIESVLKNYDNVTLDRIVYYPAGSYEEPSKIRLDNIDDFYVIYMKQRVGKNHTGTFRVYLPAQWNQRFMGIAGAGTNNEVDWFTAVTFNVISWPMALKNGYACAVADNDTGIHLDCSWGFDSKGQLEWDHMEAWKHSTLHEMTLCAKEILLHVYGQSPSYSYIHGTSGGGRQVLTEALMYPEDYDGLWADGPSVHFLDLMFSCVWAPVVEANEKHIVGLAKYKLAHQLVLEDPVLKNIPYDSREICWMDFAGRLLGQETEDGPITRRDLQVMVKTWDGPFTCDGKRMGYGFGPAIRQWPVETRNQFYGYFKRKEDGRLGLMPIAEQALRWFTHNPTLDVHSCSYDQFEKIYRGCRKEFRKFDFNNTDFSKLASRGGKVLMTHGTGDCVVPYQAAIDYYQNALDHFPSERMMNDCYRMFMPDMAGHSILDWSGGAISCSAGMKALTDWVEKGITPDVLPTVWYDFQADAALQKSDVEVFNQWHYKQMIKSMIGRQL